MMPTSPTERRKLAGFTLIELMIALSLAGLVSSAIYGAWSMGAETSRRVQQRLEADQYWRYLITQLRRDLSNLTAAPGPFLGSPQGWSGDIASTDGVIYSVAYVNKQSSDSVDVWRNVRNDSAEPSSGVVVYSAQQPVSFRYLTPAGWSDNLSGDDAQGAPLALEVNAVQGGQRRVIIGVEVDSPPPVEVLRKR
ncbi:PulJ/GspJ family protein [Magnetofaba australis]|uniref:PulJ/GspJ family protein n=1 Tax=Magnetofaba australis TaxID=1472297 RepID=UPI001301F4D2|nr:prepilin-type N-terminal cleavage/methylation domain-containing protein [Magnetofaba australis]